MVQNHIQTSLILRQRPPPKPYTLKISYQFCDNCKIPSYTCYLKEAELKIVMFAHLKEYHGNHNIHFKSLIIWFWGTLPQKDSFEWILNHIFQGS